MTTTLAPADTLAPEEAQTLLLSLARSRGPDGFHTAEAHAVIHWAHSAQVNHAALQLVLNGLADIDIIAGEIALTRSTTK